MNQPQKNDTPIKKAPQELQDLKARISKLEDGTKALKDDMRRLQDDMRRLQDEREHQKEINKKVVFLKGLYFPERIPEAERLEGEPVRKSDELSDDQKRAGLYWWTGGLVDWRTVGPVD